VIGKNCDYRRISGYLVDDWWSAKWGAENAGQDIAGQDNDGQTAFVLLVYLGNSLNIQAFLVCPAMSGPASLSVIVLSCNFSQPVRSCEQQLSPSTVQFTAQIATYQLIFVYHNRHGRPRRREENRTDFILFLRSGKSEAERK